MNGCIYRTKDNLCSLYSKPDKGKNIESWCVGNLEPCDGRVQSNADRIRSMSDEELATNFASRCCPKKDEFYDCGKLNGKSFSWEDCRKCWLSWLKSPEVDE